MVTLAQIAEALGRPVEGDGALRIERAAEPAQAGSRDLALAMSPAYAGGLARGRARAAILWADADWRALGLDGAILVDRPRLAMAGVTAALDPGPSIAPGVHPSAVVDPTARLGDGAAVGPLAVIGPEARIGARARIGPHVSVGDGAQIGCDALLHAGARVGARVRIGDRVVLQPGACVGGDGFSFVTPQESAVERVRRTLGDAGEVVAQAYVRIHSLGAVVLGDDVEVGANATIDRGTVADTIVGRGTKIDNLVMVAHNVRIGADCLLCAHVGIAGGTTIGDRVVLAGKVGVNDNITIGDDVVAGGGSNIFTRVRAGEVILGSPAMRMETNLALYRALRRLPRALEQLAALRGRPGGGRDDG